MAFFFFLALSSGLNRIKPHLSVWFYLYVRPVGIDPYRVSTPLPFSHNKLLENKAKLFDSYTQAELSACSNNIVKTMSQGHGFYS